MAESHSVVGLFVYVMTSSHHFIMHSNLIIRLTVLTITVF